MTFDLDLYVDPAPCKGHGPRVMGEDHSQLTTTSGCSQVTAKLQNGTFNSPDEPTNCVLKGEKPTEVLELDSSSDNSDSVYEFGVGIDLEVSQAASSSESMSENCGATPYKQNLYLFLRTKSTC